MGEPFPAVAATLYTSGKKHEDVSAKVTKLSTALLLNT
jgi:hypothetical protein